MNATKTLYTDAALIASFLPCKIARRQYTVYYFSETSRNYVFSVWADNKKEALRLSREYAARILNRSFESITIGA